MHPERPRLPSEAIELYNRYIHGEISRRDFLNGAKRFAVAGLTAGTIVEALMPNYALAQQVSKTDDRIKASYEPFAYVNVLVVDAPPDSRSRTTVSVVPLSVSTSRPQFIPCL